MWGAQLGSQWLGYGGRSSFADVVNGSCAVRKTPCRCKAAEPWGACRSSVRPQYYVGTVVGNTQALGLRALHAHRGPSVPPALHEPPLHYLFGDYGT